jgi:hypothetical protein
MHPDLAPELLANLKELQRALPPGTEIASLLKGLEEPIFDKPTKDRYIGLVAAAAVEKSLFRAVEGRDGDDRKDINFKVLIDKAVKQAIVTTRQGMELHNIREIRNVFAHTLTPVTFETPGVAGVCKKLFHHPVTNWASYLSPIFPPRIIYVITCAEFFKLFMGRADRGHDQATSF